MSTKLETYQKKQEELKAMETEVIGELQVALTETLKAGKTLVERLMAIAPTTNVDELVEWSALVAVVNPKPTGKGAGRGKRVAKPKATGKGKKTGKRVKVDDADILKFIKTEQTFGEIQKKFKMSPVTTGKRLDALKKAGKATVKKDGTKRIWKAA